MKEEWISGKNPVLEAIRSNRSIHKVWIAEGALKGQTQQIYQAAKQHNVIVQKAPRKKLDDLAGTNNHQGVVASVAAYQYAELDDIFERAQARKEEPFILLLDEIADPHNLGSILRTADAVGAHGAVIPKRRSVGLTQAVAKSSTGAIEHVPVARVTNMARTMDELKKRGVWLAGTDASGKEDFRQWDGSMPLGLVIGSEGKGMSRLVKEKCDFLLQIPMVGHVTSLNASVAASLLMYEVYRKRYPLGSE
ncbi:23S rRNA (guanosine2251-2'-O)-methyltransferase [Alteribacillus persepolensis]|uniref:23S rRNA (Guanosine2251-2'-O)-methyltransferase n=1 Tax=Alteribacillus persepolensis TaxID=568899 RepID=A0A1G8HI41_9BACI|nr:23S rRNA (guanosine(2251)-2'-O)-methyltransferase RlmB [Alteribacillus persepolensis]SDI06344.1 23S rRNA (guanosine2251-2'-O)-methyltransferase [Alteribacillus persepolensis]